jgi:GTP-binding protein LepA
MTNENRKIPLKNVRNFSIIAHIDHGKSTIADRLLEFTHAVPQRELQEQMLDDMDLERERGITIKAHPVTMEYKAENGELYQFNLIDTPGHVDFTYEVSRSLQACEGALLVVDAAQGVQAQTMANVFLAIERDLEILTVLNKVDLPAADVEGVKQQVEDVIGLDTGNSVSCSAKTGLGIEGLLEAVVNHIPSPAEPEDDILKALVFDSLYDPYRGVVAYIRVMNGEVKKGDSIKLMATNKIFEVNEVGIFAPAEQAVDSLLSGEVGYVVANIKKTEDVKVGDTMTFSKSPCAEPLEGFSVISPVVFAGIYPIDSTDFEGLRDALVKLQLNDSALHIEQESSQALGFGFRCGFLGLLHLEITMERLEREFNLEVLTTAPSVIYKVNFQHKKPMKLDNPAHYPDPSTIDHIEEPYVECHIMAPADYLGAIMSLGKDKRGNLIKTESVNKEHLLLTYSFPLNEIIIDFNDKLKSITKGYASFDYEFKGYERGDIVKLEIKVNDEVIDPFSVLVHRSKAEAKGRSICKKLKDVIPRQMFKVPIQAAIGGKIIGRETIGALSKNVTAKCYGGDITRKRKLWEKQKKGKKKMKEFGKVSIPQSAFMKVLKSED